MTTSRPARPGLFERAQRGALALPSKRIAKEARAPSRGPRGETLAHWLAWHGAQKQLLQWIDAEGPALPDAQGALPAHWLACRQIAGWRWDDAWSMARGSKKIRGWLAPQLDEVDGLGRDPLGLICARFGWSGADAFWRMFPQQTLRGARLGSERLGVGELLLALGWSLRDPNQETPSELSQALAGPLLPRPGLPAALSAKAGLWSEPMWDLAMRSIPKGLRANMQAREIQEALAVEGSASAPKRL